MEEKRRKVISKIGIYILLLVWALFVLFPFYWMVLTSFKTYSAYNSETIPQFIAIPPTFENYISVWTVSKLGRYMLNTIIFSTTTTFLMVFVSLLAAFAFARLEFRGKILFLFCF